MSFLGFRSFILVRSERKRTDYLCSRRDKSLGDILKISSQAFFILLKHKKGIKKDVIIINCNYFYKRC